MNKIINFKEYKDKHYLYSKVYTSENRSEYFINPKNKTNLKLLYEGLIKKEIIKILIN